ncbi:MAG: glycosyltransferase [Chloroflexi bacterium]|nr:glycosyltransferase [Chloroflexota bacterium]MBV9892950.1 glycosyltransferase [Chloroflexota bacterium]
MKVIHVPFGFPPDVVGGTEVYVGALAREQVAKGEQAVIAAPGAVSKSYADDGLAVHRFAVSKKLEVADLYGGSDQVARREFADIMDRERPDVVHLHAFTSAVSTDLAQDVQERGCGLVFTYHTPTVSCLRGTLLRCGREVCDGVLDVKTCTTCVLQGLGVGQRVGAVLGAMPTGLGRAIGSFGLAGGTWTAARMTDLVNRQHTSFRALMRFADRVVVLCNWAGDVLRRNGVPAEKLVLSRHGLPRRSAQSTESRCKRVEDPLRIAFFGRLHPTKGVDTLVRAITGLPAARLELDVFGIDGDSRYAASLREIAQQDSRIRFCDAVGSDAVPRILAEYDVLAVPSRWLETGPLVVLEAFAAGVPVIGSNLGGIAELVTDGVDGLLVETDSVAAWQGALTTLETDSPMLRQLRAGVRPPRSMSSVADDMLAVYDQVRLAA